MPPTFSFAPGMDLRVITHMGNPWFVAKDVCRALYGDRLSAQPSKNTAHLDASEKGIGIVDTLRGPQKLGIISESGLYSLIMRSRKPEAQTFRKIAQAVGRRADRQAPRPRHPRHLENAAGAGGT